MPDGTQSHSELVSALTELKESLSSYRAGETGETELKSRLEDVHPLLARHGDYGAAKLAEAASMLSLAIPDVSSGTLRWREPSETVSRRSGNPTYGNHDNGQWVFHEQFLFIPDVMKRQGI